MSHTRLEHMCKLEIDQPGHQARLTSIIGTIGEAQEIISLFTVTPLTLYFMAIPNVSVFFFYYGNKIIQFGSIWPNAEVRENHYIFFCPNSLS